MKDMLYADMLAENFPFWEKLEEDQKDMMCEGAVRGRFDKGASLHSGSDDCAGVLLVEKGQLRVYMLSEDGREITLYRLFDGDICVLSASCVLDSITFDVFIDAEEDTDVFIVNSSVFNRVAEENIYVKCFSYEQTTARFSDVMWTMQQILFMGIDRRLAIFLWDEMSKTGSDRIMMTHEQIARYMGSAREVVSRMLKYFAGEGIVKMFRGGIKILDKEKLRELI